MPIREEIDIVPDEIKLAARDVVDTLKPKNLTVAEVRDVLRYIDQTIEYNVYLK